MLNRNLAVDAGPVALPRGLGRRFGDLRIRPKLILLHNVFFLTLTAAVYFTLIPPFEKRVYTARSNEIALLSEIFANSRAPLKLPRLEDYQYREGDASGLAIPPDIVNRLNARPGAVVSRGDVLYKKDPTAGTYKRLTLPTGAYEQEITRARNSLFC